MIRFDIVEQVLHYQQFWGLYSSMKILELDCHSPWKALLGIFYWNSIKIYDLLNYFEFSYSRTYSLHPVSFMNFYKRGLCIFLLVFSLSIWYFYCYLTISIVKVSFLNFQMPLQRHRIHLFTFANWFDAKQTS